MFRQEGPLEVEGILNGTPVAVTISGGSGGGTSSDFGAAFPAAGTAAGFKDSSGNMAGVELEADGSLPVTVVSSSGGGATSATLSNVAGSDSSVTLLASNAARKQAIVWNDSSAILYVKYGATAAATDCTFQVQGGQTLIFPLPIYAGQVDGIWDSATGAARITEY